MLERALAEVRAQYPQAGWAAALAGGRRLAAGSPPAEQELVFAMLCEVGGAGPLGPSEAWLEGESGAVIAAAHPYGEAAVALGFSPAVSPGAARRIARGLLGELAGCVGRALAPETLDDGDVESALAVARARLAPLVGPWLAERAARAAWERARDDLPADPDALRRFRGSLR